MPSGADSSQGDNTANSDNTVPTAQPPVVQLSSLPTYVEFDCDDETTGTYGVARWNDWIEGLETMLDALGINNDTQRRSLLLHYLGATGRKLLKKLSGPTGSYPEAKATLTAYLTPKLNRIFLMNQLLHITQQNGEKMDRFYHRVKEIIDKLSLEKLSTEKLIELLTLSQLVSNCNDTQLRKKALRDNPSLENFLDGARAQEQATVQTLEMEQKQSVNRVERESQRRTQPRLRSPSPNRAASGTGGNYSNNNNSQNSRSCYKCGGKFPHRMQPCPAIEATCNYCRGRGHFEGVCFKKRRNVRAISDSDGNEFEADESFYAVTSIQCIDAVSRGMRSQPITNLEINNTTTPCLIDTGAEVNVADERLAGKLGMKPNQTQSKLYAFGPNGKRQILPILGQINVCITNPNNKEKIDTQIFIMEGHSDTLLGCKAAVELGLVSFNQSINNVHGVTDTQSKLQNIVKKYDSCFEGIGRMKDVAVNLHIDTSVRPVEQKMYRIPFHNRTIVEEEIDRLLKLDLIEPAEGPTPWISPVILRPKKNGQYRLCLDSRAINTAIQREKHPIPTIDDLIVRLNGAKIFTCIDLQKAYHQLLLNESCRYITSFATHLGLFRYKVLCFGINSAAEIFQRHISQIFKDIPCVINISDDLIIFNENPEEHLKAVEKVLQRLKEHNLTASREKCTLGAESAQFYGHVFSKYGIAASEDKVRAILEADTPKSGSEVLSFLGLCQYVSRFIPEYSTITQPLRNLTKKNAEFIWDCSCDKALKKLKSHLAERCRLNYFAINLPTELIVDASPVGVCAILTQCAPDGRHIISFASRALSDTEKRYSQTEKELLAIVWGCEHYYLYLYGAPTFTIITDHLPLVGILENHTRRQTIRIERLCLRMLPFKFRMEHRPGKGNPADYLSRRPMTNGISECSWVDHELQNICINAITSYSAHAKPVNIKDIVEATKCDITLQKVIQMIEDGKWSNNPETRQFNHVKQELAVHEGVLLRSDQVVIPQKLQKSVIQIAHASHQGIVKTKAFLRQTVWFPGLDKLVEEAVGSCLPCQALTPGTQHPPLQMTTLPNKPWAEIAVDFYGPLQTGEYLLVVIDEYSRYPEVEIVHSTSAQCVIKHLDAIFARQGCPEVMKSDNGSPFQSLDLKKWLEMMGIKHRRITPLWPKANSEAERFMRTLGKALKAAVIASGSWKQDLFRFLRHYRATPHSTTAKSPAEMLNGRKLKTELPVLELIKKTKRVHFADQVENVRARDERLKSYMKSLADERNKASFSNMKEKDHVLVKNDGSKFRNKLSPIYRPEPLTITAKKGTMVTARSDSGWEVTRNESCFKPFRTESTNDDDEVKWETADADDDSASWKDNNNLSMEEHVNIDNGQDLHDNAASLQESHIEPLQDRNGECAHDSGGADSDNKEIVHAQENAMVARRSSRSKTKPSYLKDYCV